MAYTWGDSSLPVATFDGQVYVDDKNQIFQWDASVAAWLKRPNFKIRHLADTRAQLTGVGPISVGRIFGEHEAEYLERQWADWLSFDHAFIEVTDSQNPSTVYLRQALHTLPSFSLAMKAAVPNNGTTWSVASIRVRIFEVVDTTWRPGKGKTWNALYGAMRGRKAYYGSRNRTYQKVGLSSAGEGAYGLSALSQTLVMNVFGKAAPVEQRGLVFTNARRDLYSHYRDGASLQFRAANERRIWDNVANIWRLWEGEFWVPNTGRPPMVLSKRGNIATGAAILSTLSGFKGHTYLLDSHVGVLIHPLNSVANPAHWMFMIKPLGVSHVALASAEVPGGALILAESRYRNGRQVTRKRVTKTEHAGSEDGYRCFIHDAAGYPKDGGGSPWRKLQNTCQMPDQVSFRLVNATTGVVSLPSPTRIRLARRVPNTPPHWIEVRDA